MHQKPVLLQSSKKWIQNHIERHRKVSSPRDCRMPTLTETEEAICALLDTIRLDVQEMKAKQYHDE